MGAQLVVISGPDQGRTIPVEEGQTLFIGRGEGASPRLADPHVSRSHCRLEVDAGKYRLTDLGSRTGTFVNDQQVPWHDLKPGDEIRIGSTRLRFNLEGALDATTLVGGLAKPKPAAPATPVQELVGAKIAFFEIQKKIATGTSAVVFRAHDAEHDRVVALKVLWPETTESEEEVQRFVRAMKTMMPIRHPNIVELYAAGKTGPYCWLAMEYVEGESLVQVIQRIGTVGMLDWQDAFRVAVHVARALEAAYARDIIHRNITPANILLRASDKLAKLGDLMLAKALAGSLARQITRRGELVGDVLYMSPERTRSEAEVDGRSDIYSLGATVYALLTGRPPFEGDALPEVITRIRQAEPVKPKKYQLSIPDMFEGLVLRMLAKRPGDRFQTPTDLLKNLERVAKYQGIAF